MLLLVVFYLQNKVVEFNFSRNIMQTEYMAQLSRFIYMNAIAFKCIFSLYDQKSVSRLFTVILRHSVVEYSNVLGPDYMSRAGPVSRAGARFSKLPVITGLVKLFCFPLRMGVSKVLKMVQ